MASQGLIPAYTLGHAKLPPRSGDEPEICSRAAAAEWLRWLRHRHADEAGDAGATFILLQRLMLRTGARPSELHRARWGEITWEIARTPEGHAVGLLTREEWKLRRKTGQARKILLPPAALRPLRRRFAAIAPAADDLIFRDHRGLPWSANELSRQCRKSRLAAAAAGWDLPATGAGRIRPYQWRHTAASKLIADGVDLPTAAKLLGTSIDMLLKTYVHTDVERLLSAAMVLGGNGPVRGPESPAASAGRVGPRPPAGPRGR